MEKQTDNTLCKIAIIGCGYGMFSDSVIVPILSDIYKEFPYANTFQQNFVVTGGYLFSLIAAIITGILIRKFSKKKVLIWGLFCFIIGGTGGVISNSIETLIFMRILDGISDGVLTVTALALVSELYSPAV